MNLVPLSPSHVERTRHVLASPCDHDLLLREMGHRCVNDLQLVVSLLALQGRRTANIETRQALADTMRRVAILADARSYLLKEARPTLKVAMRTISEALRSQAEPRGIILRLDLADPVLGLSTKQITTLALVINELATNAIKHAFQVDCGGHVILFSRRLDQHTFSVGVDDDGVPFPSAEDHRSAGLGLSLARRLVDSIGGLLVMPLNGSKRIEVRISSQDV
jgi:two-component sensor histidine kinase